MEDRFTDNPKLFVNNALRIAALGSNKWEIIHLTSKRKINVNHLTMAVVLHFIDGEFTDFVLQKASEKLNQPVSVIASVIDQLLNLDLLCFELDKNIEILEEDWIRHGWGDAVTHHLLTFDYPFLNYQIEGVSIDRSSMSKYYDEEPDISRYKMGSNGYQISCPGVVESLLELNSDFYEVDAIRYPRKKMSLRSLSILMSASFGILESKGKDNSRVVATIRRTSPSGGARHPCEGYLLVNNIANLPSGFYHFSTGQNSLELVNDGPEVNELYTLIPSLTIKPITPQAIVFISVMPERNMYRYREPRTLRTIFMDAAHIASTVEIVGKSLGFKVFGHHGFNQEYFDALAKFPDPISETFVYMVALEGCIDQYEI